MNALYNTKIPSQAAYENKDKISCCAYLTLNTSYRGLKLGSGIRTISAYDLYIELLCLFHKHKKQAFDISAKELMYRASFSRPNTFHEAKNILVTAKAVEYKNHGYTSANTYTHVKHFNADRLCKIPWPIWNWLGSLVLKKIITRHERHMYIQLYNRWEITGREKTILFSMHHMAGEFFKSPSRYRASLTKLQILGLLEYASSSNQKNLSEAMVHIPLHLKFGRRRGSQVELDPASQLKTTEMLNNLIKGILKK